jgi:hypothetical protein
MQTTPYYAHKGRGICQVAISGSEDLRIPLPRTPVNRLSEEA